MKNEQLIEQLAEDSTPDAPIYYDNNEAQCWVNGHVYGFVSGFTKCQNELPDNWKAKLEAFEEMKHGLKEAYEELKFHNWHNTTTGMKIESILSKIKDL